METNNSHTFLVENEICLGYTCFGGSVSETGFSSLVLTDDELNALVDLIRESGTSDVKEMKLEEKFPKIYKKLDDACFEAAQDAEEEHWLEAAWENSDVFDPADHIEFGEKNLGYKFEYDETEFMDEDGKIDEDYLEDAKKEDFSAWLTHYKDSLEGEERRKFMRQFIDIDLQGVEYEIKIPEEILDICDKREKASFDDAGKITYYEPYNGYRIFKEGNKFGFFELNNDTKSPLFDEIDVIEMGEAIRVRKDGEWGFLAKDFTFLPEKEVEVNDDLSDMIYWFGWE